MLSGMSLSRKLTLLVVTALLALAAVAAAGFIGLKSSHEMMDEVAKVRMSALLGISAISEGKTAIRSENRMVAMLLVQSAKPEEFGQVLRSKEAVWKRIGAGWNIYESLPQTPEEATLWKRFLVEWEAWKKADTAVNEHIGKLAQSQSDEARNQARADYVATAYAAVPLFVKAETTLGEIVDLNVRLAGEAAKLAEAQGEKAMAAMALAALVAAALLAALGAAIARNIFNTIGGEPDAAKAVVERIATGDLTQSLSVRPGDTGSLIAFQQKMQGNLLGVMRDLSVSVTEAEESANSLASASQQVAAASADTSDSASSMAASVEQLSVSINQVSEHARSVLTLAEQTGQLSLNGGEVIDGAVAEINRIADTVRATAANMDSLSQNSTQISSVVQVIKDVADQTNLLALNAAIEAARAGEAGRGFAVVADEVRKLAERTTAATVEIGKMIARIQSDTENSVATMEDAVTQVDKGVGLASQAGNAIHEIRESVDRVVATVNDIVNSIQEQSIASQQIAQRVERVAQASEENNAAAEQTAESADDLKHLAARLKAEVGKFKTA